jgi:hypothetical protein
MVLPPKGTVLEDRMELEGFSFHAGTAHSPDRGHPAKLQINLFATPKLSLWVLDTDYTTYAVVYSCSLKLGGMTSDQVCPHPPPPPRGSFVPCLISDSSTQPTSLKEPHKAEEDEQLFN